MNKPSNIPVFSTEQKAADWYATHDTAPFMDRLEEVHEPMLVQRTHPRKKPIGLRIRSDYLEMIKIVAARKGIPYQTLIQMWLVEKLDQEGQELPGR